MAEKRVELPKFERVAQFRAESFNADDHTIEIVWTTGASVRRYDYWDGTEYDEELSLEPGAIRLERLNLGAPFLDSHNSYGCSSVLGAVVRDTAVVKDGRGTCRIKLSRAPGDADTVSKIRDGIICNTSVGYWIHTVEKTDGKDGKIARWFIKDWEPLEISAVPIPADPGSQIRAADAPQDGTGPQMRSCTFVTRDPPAAGPKKANQENPMAQNRTAPPKKKTADERMSVLEGSMARILELLTAKRGEDGDDKEKGKEDERASEDADDKREGDDAGDERSGDDDKEDGDDEADDKRGEDDDDDKDERAAPAAPGKRSAPLSAAEVRKAAEAAVRADRVRGSEIRSIAARFGYPNLGEKHANGETSVRAFKDLVIERLAERQAKNGSTTFSARATPEIDEDARFSPAGRSAPAGRAFEAGAAEAEALLARAFPGRKKAA